MKRIVFDNPNWSEAQQDCVRRSHERLGLCACGSDETNSIVLLLLARAQDGNSVFAVFDKKGHRTGKYCCYVIHS